jgi:betaine-aldehyde dehydrogenase
VSLELGGTSPFVVFADSDLEKAVEWILFGIVWNQGQVCSATSRVIVEAPLYDWLLGRFVEEAERIRIGDGLAEGTLLGLLVNAAQYRKVLGHRPRAKTGGQGRHGRQGAGLQPRLLPRADGERAERVAAAFRAGIVWINCSQPTFTEAPWGGNKQSGIGRELGRWGLENYLETKQITRLVSDEPWEWYIR